MALVGFSMGACSLAGLAIGPIVLGTMAWISTFPAKVHNSVRSLLLVVVLIAILPLMMIPDCNASGRRGSCKHKLRMISGALLAYHKDHGYFPPAYVADANGKPMHSWRVLILPYMEHTALHDQYNFDEPWNGPNNKKLAVHIPRGYLCPSNPQEGPMTNYLAVVGPKAAWTGSEPTKRSDIADAVENTIMLVEVADSGVNWMEPRDITLEQALAGIDAKCTLGISSPHQWSKGSSDRMQSGAHVATLDGNVHVLPQDLPSEALEALLTKDGGETVEIDTYDPEAIRRKELRSRNSRMALVVMALVVSVLLLVSWLRKSKMRKGRPPASP